MLLQLQPARDGRSMLSLILYLDHLPSFVSPLCHGLPLAAHHQQLSSAAKFNVAAVRPESQVSKRGEGIVEMPGHTQSSGEQVFLSWGLPSHTVATNSAALSHKPLADGSARAHSKNIHTCLQLHNARCFSATVISLTCGQIATALRSRWRRFKMHVITGRSSLMQSIISDVDCGCPLAMTPASFLG